jgi:signal transduction histidine kinase
LSIEALSFQQVGIHMAEEAGESVGEKALKSSQTPSSINDAHHHSTDHVQLLIDELRRRTAELEEANRELRRVSHYRSLFLARMSHELRTPLTAILGFSEILLDQEQLTETQRRFCQKVQDSGFQLQASVNHLVDLSRLETGQTELFLQELSLRETLRESCAAAARMAQKRHVTVEYELAPELTTIVSDKSKLRQVIFGFIAWAISRSPEGEAVMLSVEPDGPMVQIKVTDRGERLEDIGHVFAPDSESSQEPNINELGVIIGSRLLELLDGSVSVRNLETCGLEVLVQLPARPLKG